jgi:hypothetical protein
MILMKKKFMSLTLVFMVLLISISSFAATTELKNDLLYLYQEEKVARDVYAELYDMYGLRTFDSISNSEQSHMDAVEYLLNEYQIDYSNISDERGVYQLPELQKLYDTLIEKGSESIINAIEVGATIEDLDIFDLDEMLSKNYDADVDRVLSNLKKGSENHMRAFIRQLTKYNETYTPKYISQEYFESII